MWGLHHDGCGHATKQKAHQARRLPCATLPWCVTPQTRHTITPGCERLDGLRCSVCPACSWETYPYDTLVEWLSDDSNAPPLRLFHRGMFWTACLCL